MANIKSLVYDFRGESPARVMIPHVTCMISKGADAPAFHGVLPLDTGAKSDITLHSTLKSHIEKTLSGGALPTPLGGTARVRVGPLSAIVKGKDAYHAEHEPHVGEVDVSRFLPAQSLSVGSRRDGKTTLSLKAMKLAGRCPIVDPSGKHQVKINDYGGEADVYSTDVEFAPSLEGFEYTVKYDIARIDPLPTTNFMPPGRLLTNKQDEKVLPFLKEISKKAVCWDTGAAYTCVNGQLFRAWKLGKELSKTMGIIDELSFLTTDKMTLLRFTNVPVRIDDNEIIIGAQILNLFRMGFDANGGRVGLTPISKDRWKPELIPFESDKALGEFVSWKIRG